MNEELNGLLTRIPEPTPPPAFKATVMARIAREADRPLPDAAVVRAERKRDRRAWILIPIGLLLAAGAVVYPYFAAQVLPDLSVRMSPVQAGLMPEGTPVLIAVVGLLLYLAGLFATLPSASSTSRR